MVSAEKITREIHTQARFRTFASILLGAVST
jgi:hypothetical protein